MALPIDPVAEDDETLAAVVTACQAEQARRASLRSAPSQAVTACWQYKAAGGDPRDIVDLVQAWINEQAT